MPPLPQATKQLPRTYSLRLWWDTKCHNATCQEKEVEEIKGITGVLGTRAYPPSSKVFQIKAAVFPNTAIAQKEATGLIPE